MKSLITDSFVFYIKPLLLNQVLEWLNFIFISIEVSDTISDVIRPEVSSIDERQYFINMKSN